MRPQRAAVHFGIVPGASSAHVHHHTDPTREVTLDLPENGDKGFIVGTWEDWDTSAEPVWASLHVVVFTDHPTDHEHVASLAGWLRLASAGARLVDVACVTEGHDWSMKTHIIDLSTRTTSGIYVYEVAR